MARAVKHRHAQATHSVATPDALSDIQPKRPSRVASGLNDLAIKALKPADAGKHADGRGLYLLVTPAGGKLWRYDYRLHGKRKKIGLGSYPDVSLAKAREQLQAARTLVADGIDPVGDRRATARAARSADTLRAVVKEWQAKRSVAPTTKKRNDILLNIHILPKLGDKPIGLVTAADVLEVVRDVEGRGRLASARRCRQLIGQILRYATATGRQTRDVTADLRGALQPEATVHRAALTAPDDIGALLRAIDGYQGEDSTAAMLRLAPLLFVRPGNLRHMLWAEIDWAAALWRIPAAKMKTRQDHLVPLSRQALAIIKEQQQRSGDWALVFPGFRSKRRPLSDNTLNAALRALGYTNQQMTSHGFRAMASTRLHELGYPPDVIERQLAHREPNQSRRPYNRAQHLPERIAMMAAWADHLDELRATKSPR